MNCDVGKATEGLENELWRRWSDEAHSPTFRSLHLRHSSFSNPSFASPTSQEWAELILQPFRRFTYVIAHSPTLPSLYLRHSSFSNPSVASPTSQIILQPFFRFSYVTGSSLTSLGESPMPHTVTHAKTITWEQVYTHIYSHVIVFARFIAWGEKNIRSAVRALQHVLRTQEL